MRFLLILISFLILLACSIKSPEFTITGQKTALEQQVLGSYQQLTDNAIVTTSARTGDQGTSGESQEQQVILEAIQSQKFNKDEINELKREQVVGENNRGYVEVRPTPQYNQDESYHNMVDKLVEAENRDRRIIYQRVLLMNQLSQQEERETNLIFANMQIEQSPPGTLIQLSNGEWIEKGEEKK
jgi:uncharacterized protein YdbL (DUF1318 family)